ncbi:putative helicase domino-like 3 [Homarus americanus]|uniref:Putative helicase domino-like 3 n=2 Tax=Homarus americanus TaxID=6706 RepID=A0A8J5JWC5_HOMAM|nr:putative helicase domino-like 3 [Homarus americanus]
MTVATVTAATITTTATTSSTTAAILGGVRTAAGAGNTGRTTLALQELQVRTSGSNQSTVVSVAAGLAQLHAAKLTATLSSQSSQKGVAGVTKSLTPAQLQYLKSQAQARQALLQQQQGKVVATSDQTIKRVQIAGQAGTTQKVQVAVSSGALAAVTAIQVSQAGRTQLMKPGTVVAGTSGMMATGKAVTRTVTDREVAAILKQQQLNKSAQVAQIEPLLKEPYLGNTSTRSPLGKSQIIQVYLHQEPSWKESNNTGIPPPRALLEKSQIPQVQVPSAQLLAGLQVQGCVSGGGTPVATLVKTVSAPSTLVHTPTSVTLPVSAINVTLPQARVTTAATVAKAATTQQTVRNIPLPQQLLTKQRSLMGVKGVGLQLGSKTVGSTGLNTVQIVQGGGQKQMSHVTVQQIQQVLKQVPQQTIQHITQGGTVSGTVVGKAVCNTVTGTSVTASGSQGISTSHTTKLVPMTIASHQQQPIKQTIQVVSAGSTVVGGGSAIRVSAGERSSPSTLALSAGTVKVTNPALLSAALQGQPMSVAVRPSTQSPVRIQTSALQTQQTTQTQQQQQTTQQQGQQQGGVGQ